MAYPLHWDVVDGDNFMQVKDCVYDFTWMLVYCIQTSLALCEICQNTMHKVTGSQVLQGCKEAVILQEDEGMYGGGLFATNIPGTTAFAFDPFNAQADTPGRPTVGWYMAK